MYHFLSIIQIVRHINGTVICIKINDTNDNTTKIFYHLNRQVMKMKKMPIDNNSIQMITNKFKNQVC
ncbi:unnamed protein product [Brugia pahangi]|uniref:Secreted protein n=1 Tax=Brugia pahangi TaxID=6280 RepID=A0A0N4TB28_BRUPA|nr:unnamed protein product [Brugia pahangi]